MNPMDVLNPDTTPPAPAKLKVFAPNGDTTTCIAYLGIRKHQQSDQIAELVLQTESGFTHVLSKKVVVQNLETGVVCYNPRTINPRFGNIVFITYDEKKWLKENPHWPAILELQDNPVEHGQ